MNLKSQHANQTFPAHELTEELVYAIYEEIIIVEPSGKIIYTNFKNASSSIQQLYSNQKNTIYCHPSTYQSVINQQNKVSFLYEHISGKKVLSIGTPIIDSFGKITKIIFTSTEIKNMIENDKSLSIAAPSDSFLIYSDKMKDVIHQAHNAAKTSATVLLIGESGVGKEMVATEVHRHGSRSNYPFIKVNCGAIPEKLLETELFGYKKGAFTGADPKGKSGYFTQAHRGILFLDEISEMPLHLQVKLLRVLQEREVVPIGGTTPIKIDVQIIAATNRNLEELVEKGAFREDLYYRLNVIPISIPPLRERPEEITFLANLFIQKYNSLYNRNVSLTDAALQRLAQQTWSGNVRELENVMQRLVVVSSHPILDEQEIQKFFSPKKSISSKNYPIVKKIMPLEQAVEYVEEQLMALAMEQYQSIKKAAAILQISQPTMSRKYKKMREKAQKKAEQTTNKITDEVNQYLLSITSITAASINIDDVKLLINQPSEKNSAYIRLQKQLTSIRTIEGQIEWNFIFIVKPDHTIFNLVSDERLNLSIGEKYTGPKEIIDCMVQGMHGKSGVSPLYHDKFGCLQSCVVPLKDEDGTVLAILGSDFSEQYIQSKHQNFKKNL